MIEKVAALIAALEKIGFPCAERARTLMTVN
ncbi:hypothetical protein M2165_000037 [Variovorax sp. TBS-050B]|nr:hypothetical protein [Variovorax sp. TBS-050B]